MRRVLAGASCSRGLGRQSPGFSGIRGAGRLFVTGLLAMLVSVSIVLPASAQVLTLKRDGILPQPGECTVTFANFSEPDQNRPAVDSLLAAGSRAAILGNHVAASNYLMRAAELHPRNLVVSYRLARSLDDQGEANGAILEYCRYLSLDPPEADAAGVRERIRNLALEGAVLPREPWSVSMEEGIAAFDAGRFRESVAAFTRAVELRPDRPEAFYNRGVAYLAEGRRDFAIHDLETYLSLSPEAPDRSAVLSQIEDPPPQPTQALAERPTGRLSVAPSSALIQGLVLPGLGQHATGRPMLGLVVLGAVGGAIYYGIEEQTVVKKVGANDPFGNYYEYDVTTRGRPRMAQGIGAAAGIAILGALESYIYARRERSSAASSASVADSRLRIADASLQLALDGGPNRLAIGIALPRLRGP